MAGRGVLEDSPLYQEFVGIGEAKGRVAGKAEGKAEGSGWDFSC